MWERRVHGFRFQTVAHIVVQMGGASRLGDYLLTVAPQARRPLIITDSGVLATGLLTEPLESLNISRMQPAVFDGVIADPPERVIHAACKMARDVGADAVIGFGGGSAMDVAKLVAVLAGGEHRLDQIYGIDQVGTKRSLPLMQVPTTAGTGSEVTPIAVVTTGKTTKMGVVDSALFADLALLDAGLTTGLPADVTAATGIDAMVHAVEAFTSKRLKNPMSDMMARAALMRLVRAGPKVVTEGGDLSAREDMLVGAMLAGQAFTNAPVAGVHALAYPLGGFYHVSHGLSNALVLPHVLRFNRSTAAPLYAELADILIPHVEGGEDLRSEAFIEALEDLCVRMGVSRRLRDVGVPEADIPMLAESAMVHSRLLVNNPRDIKEADARQIYEAAW